MHTRFTKFYLIYRQTLLFQLEFFYCFKYIFGSQKYNSIIIFLNIEDDNEFLSLVYSHSAIILTSMVQDFNLYENNIDAL